MNPWPYPRLMAHRGGGKFAPENTLAAIRLGHSLGYRMAEVDVRFSRDGVPFLMHDAVLDRTTNGHGPVAERTWAELSVLDSGSWHSAPFHAEPLVRFEDAARELQALRMFANIEIKRIAGRHRECGELVARAAAHLWRGATEAPLLSSFSPDALAAAREAAPDLRRALIVQEPWDGDLTSLESLQAVSVHVEHVLVTPDLVARVHDAGFRILAWTVNDVSRAQGLLDMGLDGLITDNLREFAGRFGDLLPAAFA
jgi:glycerophosphoryl diester phosphodiesterase